MGNEKHHTMQQWESLAMQNNLRVELGKRIRHLRKIAQYTQEELGENSGLSYKFIGEIERGEVNPSLDSLSGIARALKINVRDLFPEEVGGLTHLSSQDLLLIRKAVSLLNKRLNPASQGRVKS